jgi:hypothetical protein
MANLPNDFGKSGAAKMGGFGSGPSGGRLEVEACRSVDVNRLHRVGCLKPGWQGGWEWKEDGERVAWISMRAEENRLVLNYRFRRNGDEWTDVDEPISVVRVPCRYGGSRPYFVCPGIVNNVSCRRRVAKLYGPDRYFLCRHCYRLGYASQSEDAMDRARRQATRIRVRLGGGADMPEFLPPRPKGMWHSTYERLRERAIAAEMAADEAFEQRAAAIMERVFRRTGERISWT